MSEDKYKATNDDSLLSLDISNEQEYFPTPLKGHHLASLNTFIKSVSGRDVSPIRAQLHSPIEDISQSTARYFRRKSLQSCMTALECIAPGQSSGLLELACSKKVQQTQLQLTVTFSEDYYFIS